MKIKNSILSLLLFFTLVPVSIFGIYSIYATNRKIVEMAERNLQTVSENQIMNIQNFCEDRRDAMEKVASYELTRDAILHSLGINDCKVNHSYVENLLLEQKNYGTFVASISILNKDFYVVESSEKYDVNEFSEMKYANKRFHTGEFVLGNAYERETDEGIKKLVPAYIGVFYEEELIGYIVEELDTAYFDELRLSMDSLEEGTFYILDGNYTIITAGNTTQKESITHLTSSSEERSDFQRAWDEIDHEAYPQGDVHYKYQGMNYVTYYSNVQYTDWGIRITENLSAQTRRARNYVILMSIMLFFIIAGITIAQYVITEKLLSPIKKILHTFTLIKEGQDYSLRTNIPTTDEMGMLSKGIDELLEYIEQADIQEKAKQHHLQEMAECDSLTGIKNKKAIERIMLAEVQRAAEHNRRIAIGFLDIDNFRDYNTNYGHQEGDAVIQFVAATLQNEVDGYVGRNGGDEFVFCYTAEMEPKELSQRISHMLNVLNSGYMRKNTNENVPVPCSIGIVTTKGTELDYVNLIQKADEAMYRAKEAGKNTFHILET